MSEIVVGTDIRVVLEGGRVGRVETAKAVSTEKDPINRQIIDGPRKNNGKASGGTILIDANRGKRRTRTNIPWFDARISEIQWEQPGITEGCVN